MIIIIIGLAFISISQVNIPYDFDGLFTMNVPIGKQYSDISWCLPNGALGCAKEYWADDADSTIDDDEFVVYYYDSSLLAGEELNGWQHAVHDLTTSYLYDVYQQDGNLLVLSNNLGMTNVPTYLVGLSNDDGSEAIFVGGYNLNELKDYANSIEFK